MAALEGKAASGFAKLPPDFLFEDLPNDRSDPLWTEIRTTYNLSLAELSALKNARCQQAAQQAAAVPQGPNIVDVNDPFHILLKVMIEAIIQQDEENFLELVYFLSDNNIVMKTLARGNGIVGKENRLVVRHFYKDFFDRIVEDINMERIYRIIVTGTPGVGKSTSRNYFAWKILHDFISKGEAVRIALHKGGGDSFYLLCLDADGSYRVEEWTMAQFRRNSRLYPNFQLGVNFFALSDVSTGNSYYCEAFDGGLIVFSSPNPDTWKQSGKENVKFYIMPLWEEEELCRFDDSAGTFKERFKKYGGVARIVWGSEDEVLAHETRLLTKDIRFDILHDQIHNSSWDAVPHRYVYLFVPKVPKDENGKYQFDDVQHVEIGVPTWHIAKILSNMYVSRLLSNQSFGGNLPSLRGLLFEAMVLTLIENHTNRCQFPLKNLNKLKGAAFPFSDTKDHFHLGTNVQVKFPSNLVKADFHTENFLDSVSSGCVFAQPISHYFPGFDAAISFDEPSLLKTTPKKSKSASRCLALFQITTSTKHPLSKKGLDILTAVHDRSLFKNVVIVFVVPSQIFEGFKAQGLASGVSSLSSSSSSSSSPLFSKTPQFCMTITTHGSHKDKSFTICGQGADDN